MLTVETAAFFAAQIGVSRLYLQTAMELVSDFDVENRNLTSKKGFEI